MFSTGEVVVLVPGGALAIALLLLARQSWLPATDDAAERLFADSVEISRGEHEYRLVSESAFPDLDVRGYLEVRRELAQLGFVHVVSYENLTASRVYPKLRTLCDALVNADLLIGASTFQAADQQISTFASLLEDGRMLTTCNAGASLDVPPQEMRELLPLETPIAHLLARHQERFAALRIAEPDARFYLPTTIEEIVAVVRRHSGVVSAFRRARGYITEQELMALARTPQERRNARRLRKRLRPLQDAALEQYFMDQR